MLVYLSAVDPLDIGVDRGKTVLDIPLQDPSGRCARPHLPTWWRAVVPWIAEQSTMGRAAGLGRPVN